MDVWLSSVGKKRVSFFNFGSRCNLNGIITVVFVNMNFEAVGIVVGRVAGTSGPRCSSFQRVGVCHQTHCIY
jgi:hypothetical protein